MRIIPAIDLWEGKVVRLKKGDPAQSTVYSGDALETARKWAQAGAKLLHLVDLSAALGKKDNFDIIKTIIEEKIIKVEVGGGIRSLAKAQELIAVGAQRVIIGTKSLDEEFLKEMIISLGSNKVAVGVDIVDGCVAVEGWQKKTALKGIDFISHLQTTGVKWVICTDISRDGTLSGVNLKEIIGFSDFGNINFIVSGGVSSLEDLKKINEKAPFVWGVIIGKALYENKIDLKTAISIIK